MCMIMSNNLNDRLDFSEKQVESLASDVDVLKLAMGKIDSRLYGVIDRLQSIEAYLDLLKKKGKIWVTFPI